MVSLVKHSYKFNNRGVYMVWVYGLVAWSFANRTHLGNSWVTKKSKSWRNYYTGNEACTSGRMTGDTSGSDTNIDSVNAKAMCSVHNVALHNIYCENQFWPLFDYAINYAAVIINIFITLMVPIQDWLMYLIWNSQTFAIIRLKINYKGLSGAFLFLLGIYWYFQRLNLLHSKNENVSIQTVRVNMHSKRQINVHRENNL